MSSLHTGLGTEAVVDEVFITMREKLNAAIVFQQAKWDKADLVRAARMGLKFESLVIEPIDPTPRGKGFPYGNFHVGSIPSFVQTDDRGASYPCLVVMPGRTIPDGEDARSDQLDVFQNAVAIHSFAKATDAEGAEVAYRRSMRMAEAVHQVMHTNVRTLVRGINGPSLVERSEPWYFPEEDGHGEDWCWQAVMHQYQIKNYSTQPQEV